MVVHRWKRRGALLALPALLAMLAPLPPARAAHTPQPTAVTIAGSLQSELGCPDDWQPACSATQLRYDATDGVWQGTWNVPAGRWEYKAALNNAWDENYGRQATANGPNLALDLAGATTVKFYYDHATHWITNNHGEVIASVAGSFQSELGCPGDWQPDCLRSWLQDPDGDGRYSFSTTAIPAGSYEAKVAINESWSENYGQHGQRDGANIPFVVPADATVTFRYDAATHLLTIEAQSTAPQLGDNNIFWDGLGHDSRSDLYRVPGGAVPRDHQVLLRFRTFHNDVAAVTLRTYHTGQGAERLTPMQRVATGVPCETALAFRCDYWAATINSQGLGTLYYRFIVRDGTRTVYYEDDSEVRDGGWGRPFAQSPDWGWAITVYDPGFNLPIRWMQTGVVYQIFPDRFRNGDPNNDPKPVPPTARNARFSKDPRYAYPRGEAATNTAPDDDQIVRMQWGELPEGFCRNYQLPDDACAWRFDQTPPAWSPRREQPRGRDYYGGDLQGVIEKLDYLKRLGVTVIYFNPIFAAGSNHRYDTRDYQIIDPHLGNLGTFKTLEREATRRGMRIVLDGVFNHMSSDSPIFDRYGNWDDATYGPGACERVDSPYRHWFRFRPPRANEPAVCAPFTRDGPSYYDSWAGFDSLPQLAEHPDVQAHIQQISRFWLQQGADGWRLDVMQDKSIPFWEAWRRQVKAVKPDAIIIGELWKKFDVLPYVQGTTADTAMNYRLRDAVLGLLAPQPFDAKGFPGSGQPITPSAFVNRLLSVREDYPDAAYYTLMNLLGSHDTERLLWVLTPGAENPQEREFNPANLAEGKQRQRLAALIQMTVPGAPTIYYGDEAGLSGDDDPDDRRSFPWGDVPGDARRPDQRMQAFYAALANLRQRTPALIDGELRFLLADDAARTVAYGRKHGDQAVLVAVNAGKQARRITIPVADYLPDGTRLLGVTGGADNLQGGTFTVRDGTITLELPALGGALLLTHGADLTPPAAPAGLVANAEGLQVHLTWQPVAGASGYHVYRSPVTGGGYVRITDAPIRSTSFTDTDSELLSGQRFFYVVTALDEVGNQSARSNQADAVPSYRIGWANLQWPPTIDYTVSARQTTPEIYGQVWIDGVTAHPGATPGLLAQVGYGPPGSDPRTWNTWAEMHFNVDAGNNDEFKGVLQPTTPGSYSYLTRYSTDGGRSWTYGDLDGSESGSFADQIDQPGRLTVQPNADQTPPAAPQNLQAFNNGPTAIALSWQGVADSDLWRYDILRSTSQGSGYVKIGAVASEVTSFIDSEVQTGTRYFYVVRAVDQANNVSPPSNEASAVPSAREVQVSFEVTPPTSTPADATLFIVGNQPQLCNWCNPHTVALRRGADGVWRVTLTFLEGTPIEYKYTLGSWDYVEKDANCGEIGNRQLRVAADADGAQRVVDRVATWRNIPPCGA